jgi:protoporphyrinogen oxidase
MKQIIIIGAGASGLAAATRLIQNGLSATSITVLEAQNRIGGRVYTITNEGNHFVLITYHTWLGYIISSTFLLFRKSIRNWVILNEPKNPCLICCSYS